MKPKKIKKMQGMLCRSIDGRVFLRTRMPDGGQQDYEIAHSDMNIQIMDDDAYVYCRKGNLVIDYGPATLGLDGRTGRIKK
jgi:hypothetical protein